VLLLLLALLEGGYRAFVRVEAVARHFYPSWEIVLKRADKMQAIVDGASHSGGDPALPSDADEASRRQFGNQWMIHREAALSDYSRAEIDGFRPKITRDQIEQAQLADMPAIIASYRQAASEWRAAAAA
jgi:hypothetical protein